MNIARWLRRGLALMLLLGSAAAVAEPQAYRLDPVHTRIVFKVGHNGFSSVMGSFSKPSGRLWFDREDWAASRLEVQVDLATLDLGDAVFNARILERRWLDAEAHPQARFVSERIEPLGPDRARVHGRLSLRGVEAPLVLDVRLNRLARTPYNGMRRTAGFSASAVLSRAAFGITAHPRAVGDAVTLMVEAEAVGIRGED